MTKHTHCLLIALGISLAAPWASATPLHRPHDTKMHYLNDLMQTHRTRDSREALLAEANQLLKRYALKEGQQVSYAKAKTELYQLSVQRPGELTVRTEEKNAAEFKVSATRYPVYGVDPYVRYECETSLTACQLRYPGNDAAWLSITRDREGARKLATVMSYLLRDLQKG